MTHRILILLPLPLLLVMTMGAHAGVYKCETGDGRITYSDRPCPDSKSSEMRVRSSSGTGSSSDQRASTSPSSSSSSDGLDCSTAVSNGQDWIESMRSVGKRNLDTGHMSKEDYNNGMKQIDEMAGSISVGNCQRSMGNNRKFFECLGDITNHLARCGQRYSPEF